MLKTNSITEIFFFFIFGGLTYYIIEILYRGYSHYSMFLCGGIVFYSISLFNRRYNYTLHLVTRMILCTFIITVIELLFGILFNLILLKQVWNYSSYFYNYRGQICLTFSILWFFLSLPVLYTEEKIRFLLFHLKLSSTVNSVTEDLPCK
jgi:uncharacterized membrane protein